MKLSLRLLFLTFFAITLCSVSAFSQTATIATDALDYPPGSTAIITGSGFQPGETVTLQVLHDPTGGDDATDPSHQPWTVIADADGNVSSTWYVPSDADELGATLKLTADGQSSGLHAEEVFTDALTTITASPTSGTTNGGFTITLTGASGSPFNTGGAPYTVTIGGNAGTSVVRVDNTHITFTAPAHAAGVVSIIVLDKNSNPAVQNGSFTYVCPTITVTAVITQALCHGGAASVTVTATGGTSPYTGTGTFSLADGITNKTYTVTDNNGCSGISNSVTATSPSQVVATATITQALCHSGPASVLVAATGGTGAYTGTGTFSLADGTSLTYTVKDANLCSATSNSVTATSPSQVVATAVITQALCHGGPASVTVTATGGTGAYTGTGTFSLADGTTTSYTVQDANGCSATSNSVTATSPSQVVATAVITQALCHGGPASVTVTATGGTGAYTGTGTFSLADGTTTSYTVQDANGCSATSNSVTASSPSQVVATATITQALCHGGPASVLVTATGGTGLYTGTGTFSLADGTTTSYTVQDANGCSATSNSVTASSPSQVVATATITQALCHGGPASVLVTATGGTGLYTGTGTFSLADGTTTSYTVQDANGCSATSNSVTATSPSQVVATAVITQALCHGGPASVLVTATGGTGAYTGTGTFSLADGTTTSYTVQDANGCSATSNSVTASSPSQVVATAVITQALCHGGPASVLVTATGGTGSYTGTGTFSLADGTTTSYTVQDANGCSATSNSVTASSPSQVVATAVITQALCHGGPASVTVTATGGTGAYTGTGTFSLADGTTTSYTVQDANGCSATSNSVTASSPSQVVATAVITQALCHGGPASVTVTATGGTGAYTGTGTFSLADGTSSTYTVKDANLCSATSNSVTASSPSQVVATATITQALCHGGPASVLVTATGGTGLYTGTGTFSLADGTTTSYTVQDANGCSATSNSVTATSPSQVVATAVITQALCHGGPASVLVTATGGTGAYTGTGTFSLADGTTTSYTVQDANGCSATSNSVTASSPSQVVATAVITQALCHGGPASVLVTATGGTGSYTGTGTFSLADGTTTSYTVQDANGCSATSNSVTASSPSAVDATITDDNPTLYYGYTLDQTANITVKPTGGLAPYTVSICMHRPLGCNRITSSGDEVWTPGANTASSNNITCVSNTGQNTLNPVSTSGNISAGGGYTVSLTLDTTTVIYVKITDKNGCIKYDSTNIRALDVRCFAGNSGIAKITMCHKTGSAKNPYVQICVDQNAVQAQLALGDVLGACGAVFTSSPDRRIVAETNAGKLEAKVLPNPTSSYFTLGFKSASNERVKLTVVDVLGRVIEQRSDVPANTNLQIGNRYHPGIYFAQVMQGKETIVLKLIKEGK